MLARRGVDYVWATSAAEAARLCEERRFEVALVDAGMRSPQAALTQLHLRGRRLRRSVVVFSTGEDHPGMDPEWRRVNLVCRKASDGSIDLVHQPSISMAPALMALFERSELEKYLTAEELAGLDDAQPPPGRGRAS